MAKKTTRKKVVTPKAKVTKIAIDEKQELTKAEAVMAKDGFAPIDDVAVDEGPQSVEEEILELPQIAPIQEIPEPTVQVPEPIPALPPDPEPEEQPEDIQALFKKHIVKEAVPEVEEPRPTRGHQQKIFGDKPVKKGGGTVRTRFTDIPIKGKRYGNVDEPETLPKGPGTIRTTGRTTTCK